MRICIDSCVFIHGLQIGAPANRRLIALIGPAVQLVVPRLVAQEVTRNLRSPEQVRLSYRLFRQLDFAFIVDEPVPVDLPAEADAFIGAFAEWMQVRYLISDNRHFLQAFQTEAFKVLDAETFVARWETDPL